MSGSDLDRLLHKAQQGDEVSRNNLISTYQPYILKVAAQVSGKFIRAGEDDEASIAMMAFNEAIDNFDRDQGVSFLSFAKTVIRRRLIDYYRKESRAANIPLSNLDEESREAVSRAEVAVAQQKLAHQEETAERRTEIEQYRQSLKKFGIEFADLVKVSPKQETARRRAMEVAKIIANTPYFRNYLYQRKTLPLKELAFQAKVSRKTLERQRKYIIAVAVILIEKYTYLQEYIKKVL